MTWIAQVILMGDRALDDVGHDFHVAMGMRREAGAGSDPVVVPHAQRTPVHAVVVAVIGEAEMEVGLEPAMVRLAEFVEGPEFDHWGYSCLAA
jgi:hypothetical protein